MSADYLLSMAHGVIVTNTNKGLLSFFAQFAESDIEMDVFFDDNAALWQVEVPVEESLSKAFGDDIAVDRSFDQISGSFEESLVFYAPSTFHSLMMNEGNGYPAFSISKNLQPTCNEHRTLQALAEALGFDEVEIGPVIWGTIL